MDTVLKEYFKSWKSDKHSRYLSWEHCYLFFRENKTAILSDEKIRDKACLNLAFYLASWGMYRGSSNLLWCDYKIFDELISELIKNCSFLGEDIDKIRFEHLQQAKEIISTHLNNNRVKTTDTLVTKILMGVFGCTPAYDRFFIDGLRKYNNQKGHKYISQSFNEDSFNELTKLSKNIKEKYYLISNQTVQYPLMRLIDAYFWHTGGGKEAQEKRANK